MKILYVALSMRGMDDIIAGGKDDRGLPSFVYPLKALIKKKHTVKIILISSYRKPINIQVDWLKNEDIIYNSNADITSGGMLKILVSKAKESLRLCRIINRELKDNHYDFVYCHGKAALFGNIIANINHVPCGYRIYGVMDMYDMMTQKGLLYTILKYPSYFVLFNLKKKFMLITDDGSRGDYVVNRMRIRNNYDIYNWKNGVNKDFKSSENNGTYKRKLKYLFTAGRVCEPKRQHRSIEVLSELVSRGYDLNLVIAGPLVNKIYKATLDEMSKKLGLSERIKFLGDVPREQMQQYAHDSISVLLFAKSSNLSNVFIECGVAGSIIITFDEPPLYEFIETGENGFFVKNSIEAANVIENILSMDIGTADRIKNKIRRKMDEVMTTWEERCDREESLIQKYL